MPGLLRGGRVIRRWAYVLLLPLAQPCMAACVEVEVNGLRSLAYDCLSQQLAAASGKAGLALHAPGEAIERQSPNRLGLFNRSATAQRMGNAFGHSVRPQRPEHLGAATPLPMLRH